MGRKFEQKRKAKWVKKKQIWSRPSMGMCGCVGMYVWVCGHGCAYVWVCEYGCVYVWVCGYVCGCRCWCVGEGVRRGYRSSLELHSTNMHTYILYDNQYMC